MYDILTVNNTLAINDDYVHWKQWDMKDLGREAAKLLLIDQTDYGTQHIFFDDNANEDQRCIVDVRDIVTGEILPYKKMINRYIVKSEPFKTILEPDYFIKQIELAEKNRDKEIQNIENGFKQEWEEEKEKQLETEWEKL